MQRKSNYFLFKRKTMFFIYRLHLRGLPICMFSDSDLNSRQILQKNSCLICWIIQQKFKKIIIGATWTCLQLRKVQKYFFKGKNVLLHWIYSLIYFKCFFSPKYTIQGKAEGIEPAYYSIVWADRCNWPNQFFGI